MQAGQPGVTKPDAEQLPACEQPEDSRSVWPSMIASPFLQLASRPFEGAQQDCFSRAGSAALLGDDNV